ncbi:hypothetical protein BH23CHL3_BH23CHL3_06370 [soil metagenome]
MIVPASEPDQGRVVVRIVFHSARLVITSTVTPQHKASFSELKPVVYDSAGSTMVKTLPSPGSDVAQILPPCASTSIRAM